MNLDDVAYLFVEQYENIHGLYSESYRPSEVNLIRRTADKGEAALYTVVATIFGDKLDEVLVGATNGAMDYIAYEPSLAQLRRIVDETGAVIVVSSSWRQIAVAYLHLKEWLAKFGLEVYDKTPYVGRLRGDDITAWFNRNPGIYQYVILDDDDDMDGHMEHLVQTDFDSGLTEEKADECIRILGKR